MHIGNLTTLAILILGGFAWLVSAFIGYDIIGYVFGWSTWHLERVVYFLLGLSALWQLVIFPRAIRTGVSDTQANIVRHP
jgi:uncharacterized membrane protein YuzA (DUF378 family)